ncbi:hypothetical protein GOBAR_AA34948 [Gossypium barbadense]|uniref:DEK-C domain-containing protein n=1 Tax=Gossypium barbadense TaxID=3634 RepID=A0A2P5W3P4_GOSBA|nr:hypothetical protein GOBAR_AA34948 [Gossypium barbadense]
MRSRKSGRDSAEKKEPVTPSSDRPTRERKVVERYSAPSVARSSSSKTLSIEKGRGTQLKDIPNVAFKLSKRKADDNLQMLHIILFGKKAKPHSLKRNIGQFSGYVWVENEEKQKAKVREKIDKCVKEKLVDFCDLLNIPFMRTSVRKEEVTAKLLEFLESPHATTGVLLADKEQKGKRRKATPSKNIGSAEASDTSAKKRRKTPQGVEKRKRSSKAEEEEDDDKVESPVTRDDSHEDDADTAPKEENDDEETKSEEEEEEPKKSSKKGTSKKVATESPESKSKDKFESGKNLTPAKSSKKSSGSTSKQDASDGGGTSGSKSKGSASKKPKVEKENSKDGSTKEKPAVKKQTNKSSAKVSAKSQGKSKTGKKPKPEPSREEIHEVVVDILKKVDFNTATLSDILRQLGTHFDLDLMHRKAEVKDIITDKFQRFEF